MSTVRESDDDIVNALISSIRYPAPREPYVTHDELYTSSSPDGMCDQFWYSHGCDLVSGHHGDHLCMTPEEEAANDYHQHGRVGIVSVCSSCAAAPAAA